MFKLNNWYCRLYITEPFPQHTITNNLCIGYKCSQHIERGKTRPDIAFLVDFEVYFETNIENVD